jgi:hypothetical protein
MERFVRVGRITLIVGGLLLAVGSGLQAATSGGDPFSAQVTTSTFAASATLRLVGATAILIGITALYLPASDRAGRFGLVAYFLVTANMVMQAGWMWADLFITGAFARNAPGVLDGAVDDARMGFGFMLSWLFNATFILLGIALLRSRTYPRGVGAAVIVMGAITLLPMPFDGPVFEVVIGSMAALAGALAARGRTASSAAPAMEQLSA